MANLRVKEAALQARLKKHGSVLVAFSGGVDSSVLLAASARTLPRRRILAVTAASPTYPADELKQARALARALGVRHRVIETAEFNDPRFARNSLKRCYYCKSELFSELVRIARKEGLAAVVDGTNLGDRDDFRPGRQAAKEWGVESPLLKARLTKPDLRALARRYALPNWNKPPAACLASRVPYGTRLDQRLLARIEAAERWLKRMGFHQVRVRHHGAIARVEVDPAEVQKLLKPAAARRAVAGLRRLGWRYVTLDLEGYRTGSLNPKS